MSIDNTLAKLDALLANVGLAETPWICPDCEGVHDLAGLPRAGQAVRVKCPCGTNVRDINMRDWPPPGGRTVTR